MTTATFKRAAVLALSANFSLASVPEPVKDLSDGRKAVGSDSPQSMAGARRPSLALDPVNDVSDISGMTLSNGMDFRDFGVQYWGNEFQRAALESAPHHALIIEPSRVGAESSSLCREEMFSPSDIAAIRRGGKRPVFGYLDVGELTRYRDYWVEAFGCAGTPPNPSSATTLPAWYGAYNQGGELLSAFWTKEWEHILQRRIDTLLSIGVDGAFLDDVLHYFSWGKEDALARKSLARGGPATIAEAARAMMALIVRLSCYARFEAVNARPSFKLIVNGAPYIGSDAIQGARPGDSVGLDLYHRYLKSIDAILVENALSRREGKGLLEVLHREYAQRGLPVLTIEDWSRESSDMDFEKFRAIVRERAEENGFRTYVVPDGLFDRLYPPVSESRESK